MGTDDMGVVDAEMRVHGVEGLRIVDASIMPELVSGNTNAPIMMMAEKIADRMLAIPDEAPLDVDYSGYAPIPSSELRPKEPGACRHDRAAEPSARRRIQRTSTTGLDRT